MSDEERLPDPEAPQEGSSPGPADDAASPNIEEFEEALREKDQFRALAQRAQADLANYKRRAVEEMDEVRRNANSDLLLKMLTVADDLQRAIAHIPDDTVAPGWLDGLALVMRNVENLLSSEGVKKIEAMGRPFEPWELEAVQYQETADSEAGVVIAVVREGYKLHDRLLRAAQVIVAKAPEQEVQTETNDQEAS